MAKTRSTSAISTCAKLCDLSSTTGRPQVHRVRFSTSPARGDRQHYVTADDVLVVLERLPYEVWRPLRAVHFNDRSRGARVLGYVNQGRREIALCALPPRVSLTRSLERRYKQSPQHFGAARGKQWPHLAVRRFLLYDVFLHELGHLQVVDAAQKSPRRKYAGEHRASEFARQWRRELLKTDFAHPDPVHSRPRAEELAQVNETVLDRS